MELLNQLKKFYGTEAKGLPHYEDDLLETAYALAEFIEAESYKDDDGSIFFDSNFAKDEEWLAEQITNLRTAPTSTMIDTVVNHMHQGMLDAMDRSGGMSEDMMYDFDGDIAEYLLNRE